MGQRHMKRGPIRTVIHPSALLQGTIMIVSHARRCTAGTAQRVNHPRAMTNDGFRVLSGKKGVPASIVLPLKHMTPLKTTRWILTSVDKILLYPVAVKSALVSLHQNSSSFRSRHNGHNSG